MSKKSAVEDVEGNRYKMLAIKVTQNSGMSLGDALSLTLVEAYLVLGANFRGN